MHADSTLFASLEDAMDALPISIENRALVREMVPPGEAVFWIPPGRQYIAVLPQGEQFVRQYINHGFVDRRLAPGRYERTTLTKGVRGAPFVVAGAPREAPRARATRFATPSTCPIHHIQVPANGVCDDCA